MKPFFNLKSGDAAFLLLFASELTFYLLILQTGIVEMHHSNMREIWMVPVGGVIGIIGSIFLYKERQWHVPVMLFFQLLLSFGYTHSNGVELFFFGLISGVTAPLLIARIDKFVVVVIALSISYAYGTYHFQVAADERMFIALFLSFVSFGASLFAKMGTERKSVEGFEMQSALTIFFWLILDAALFETLSRDSAMHIWGEASFTWTIIAFHLLGVLSAYKLRKWRHNNLAMLLLFALTYGIYTLELQVGLSIVYPFVISYYNVIILRRLMRIRYPELALIALSLWGASGLGLMIALSGTLTAAWLVLVLLGIIYFLQRNSYETLSFSLSIRRFMAHGS